MTLSTASSRPYNGRAAMIVPILSVVILSLVFTQPADGQPDSHSTADQKAHSAPSVTPPAQEQQLAVDRERLQFEKQKFVVETENEKTKEHWSAASAIGPMIAALFTLCYGIWSFRETAKLQFEIKAAEIAFEGKTPKAVENRVKFLKSLFGKRLPDNFPTRIGTGEYNGSKDAPADKEAPAEKITFLELLLKYPGKEHQIFSLWTALFEDPWLERVKPVLTGGTGEEIDLRGADVDKASVKADPLAAAAEPEGGDAVAPV